MASHRELVTNAVVGTIVGSAVSGVGGMVLRPIGREVKAVARELRHAVGIKRRHRRRRRR